MTIAQELTDLIARTQKLANRVKTAAPFNGQEEANTKFLGALTELRALVGIVGQP